MVNQLKQTAARFNLPFGERHMTYNSRLAQELGLWAEDKGAGHTFHMAAFKAYFADGKNLALLPVLLDLVAECSLPVDEAEEVLGNRLYQEAVDRDWQDSRQLQITAVPTFLLGTTRLTGAQNYPNLQGLMLQHGIQRKNVDSACNQ